MTQVRVPDVAVRKTEILYVPYGLGNGPENWIRSNLFHWDDVETVDSVMDRIRLSYNLQKRASS